MNTAVEDAIRRFPGWADAELSIGVLDGGMTNRNFLVGVDGQQFVVRIPGERTELLGIDRLHEAEVARRAPPGMASMATGGSLAFTFLGVVVGPPMFGALSGLFGTYRAGFVGLMVMASISGTVLYLTQRAR